jgi:hypothetical protein
MMMSGNAGRGLKGEEFIFSGSHLGDLKSALQQVVRAERKVAGGRDGACRGTRYGPSMIRVIQPGAVFSVYTRVTACGVFEESHVSGPRDEDDYKAHFPSLSTPSESPTISMPEPRQLQKLTRDDVTKHNKDGDLVRIISLFQLSFNPNFTPLVQWVIIDSKVYDLTRFKNLHPGGAAVLLDDDIGSLSHRSLLMVNFHHSHLSTQLAKTRPTRSMVSIATKSSNGHSINVSKSVTSTARLPPSRAAVGLESAEYRMPNPRG